MKLTPVGKVFIFLVIAAAIGIVAYKRYGGANHTATAQNTDDKSLFNGLHQAQPGPGTSVPAQPNVGSGKLDRPLIIAINTWAGHAPGIVANGGFETTANSIYAKKGIKVSFTLIEDPAAKLNAFKSGSIDVMWDTADSWAREAGILQEAGQQARAVIQEDWSRGGDGIVSLKSIQSVEDLRGKRIATTQFTPSHWLLLDLLAESGLTKDEKANIEKNLVFTAEAPLAAAAFKSGKVDAAVTWEPDLTNSVNARPNEAHVLISTAAATQVIADVLVARQDVINKGSGTLAAFVDGWFEAIPEMASNPQGTTGIVSKELKLTPDDVTGMLSGLKLTAWADNAAFFGLTTPDNRSQFASIFTTASTIWRSRGVISKVADARERVATQYVAALADRYKGEQVASEFTPPTKTAKAPASKGVINKIMMLHFAPGSDHLLPGSEYVLDSLGETLTSFGNTSLQIEGHTDATGSAAINKSLSQKRADAVEQYLVQHFQTNVARFRTYGFGSERPIASNTTQEGQAANRRTEIRVLLNQ